MFTDFADTRGEYDAWLDALTHTHERRVRVRVLDLNHGRKAWVDDVLDGQVTIDVDGGDVTRECNLRLLDPTRSIGWEPDTPAAVPLHLKRMVQVLYDVMVPGYGWVSCPVFCGPVVEVDRDGAEVNIVAVGKEHLALGSFGRGHTWAKKRKVTEVVREILELAGEAEKRIHLPKVNDTLGKPLNVSRTDKPWVQARKLARSIDHELVYDGRGHVRMRRQPVAATLRVDADWLMSPVRVDRPKVEFHNRWIVVGPKPQGDKPRVQADVALPASNPFSAQSLARGGQPRWLIRHEERNVKTNEKAREIAERLRDDKVRAAGEVSFECLPFPNVEEYDLVRAVDPFTGSALVRVRQATIPLVAGAQSIGAVRRVSRGRRHPASHGGL